MAKDREMRRLAMGVGGAMLLVARQAGAAGGDVTVFVTGDTNVVLQEQDPVAGEWRAVCVGECERAVSTASVLRVVPTSGHPSEPFTLTTNPGDTALLHVKSERAGLRIGGIVSISLGATSLAFGSFMTAIDSFSLCFLQPCQHSTSAATPVGAGLMVAGGLGIAIGLALLAVGSNTDVQGPIVPASTSD